MTKEELINENDAQVAVIEQLELKIRQLDSNIERMSGEHRSLKGLVERTRRRGEDMTLSISTHLGVKYGTYIPGWELHCNSCGHTKEAPDRSPVTESESFLRIILRMASGVSESFDNPDTCNERPLR